LFTRVIEGNEKIAPGNLASLQLIVTDLYRRAGEFEKAKKVLNSIMETNSIEKLKEVCEIMSSLVQSKNTTVKSFDDYYSLKKSKKKDEPGESTGTQLPF
jgi:predicted membrane GTPase involved in stress response